MSMPPKLGLDVLQDPRFNKGTCFTDRERDALRLRGLLPPRVFSMVGSVVSVNCVWQLGHHDTTCPDLLRASLSMVLSAKRPEVATSPVRICTTPQQ